MLFLVDRTCGGGLLARSNIVCLMWSAQLLRGRCWVSEALLCLDLDEMWYGYQESDRTKCSNLESILPKTQNQIHFRGCFQVFFFFFAGVLSVFCLVVLICRLGRCLYHMGMSLFGGV